MDNIYLHHDNEQVGPFTEEKVRLYLQEGRIQPSTMAWIEGTADWKPISEMLGLPSTPSVQAPPPPRSVAPSPQQQVSTYSASQAPQATPHNPKKLILASWLMIGFTCLVALIPGIGFLTWIVAAPILLVTFIMGILTLSKGKTLQGVSILLVSLIAAPIFLVVAPIITTAGAVAASESGSGGSSNNSTDNEEFVADSTSSDSVTSEPVKEESPRNQQSVASIGDKVKMNDSEWEVVSAKELGNVLGGGDFVDAKRSEGKFIYVRYKVTNNTSEEQQVLFTPSVRDSKGRKFEEMDDLEMYLGENETGMTMEQLPSGLPKSFSAIFEVPSDASGFLFMTRDFEAFQKQEKGIRLGF
jgi:hypothetical protein